MNFWPWKTVGKTQWSWVEASGLYIPKHFSFEEMTRTDHADLQEANRREAKDYRRPLLELVEYFADPIREHFGKTYVTSGFRGRDLNKEIGGSLTSQHCVGEAMDFNVRGKESREGRVEVMRWLITDCRRRGIVWGQMLLEGGCIHVSLPGASSRNVVGWWAPGNKVEPIAELEGLV